RDIGAVVERVRSGVVAEVSAVDEEPGPLAGRVIVVTGAARGLGRAYTAELARQGAAVVASDVDDTALKHACAGEPGGVYPVAWGATDPRAPRALLDAALGRFGQLHGLVSNAGLLRSGRSLRLSDEDLRLLLDVHVTAAFRLLRVLGGYWRAEAKAGRAVEGAVVLTTSAAGLYGFRAEAAYSAAKAAVATLARVAADEMARYQVTVNAVAPVARTRLTSWLGDGPGGPGGPETDPLAAEHVAPVVAWLLGAGARAVTGRVIEAGNGQVSVPTGWQPGTAVPLPSLMSPHQAQELMPRLLGRAGEPPGLLAADLALSADRPPPGSPRAS